MKCPALGVFKPDGGEEAATKDNSHALKEMRELEKAVYYFRYTL